MARSEWRAPNRTNEQDPLDSVKDKKTGLPIIDPETREMRK
jgi:hypothetical protein